MALQLNRTSSIYGKLSLASLSLGCVIVGLFYTQAYYLPNFLFHLLTLEFVCGILIFKAQAHFTRQTFILATIAALLLFIQVFFTQQLAEHNQVLSDKPQGFFKTGFLRRARRYVGKVVTVDRFALFTWPTWLVYLGKNHFPFICSSHTASFCLGV